MTYITSICIPRIDSSFSAEFIADVFNRNGIAKVSKIYMEPYNKNLYKSIGMNGFNRAYIGIKTWYDTEAAFNFIDRLRNPSYEARIVYSDDNWWPVDINNNINKIRTSNCVLTVFEEKQEYICAEETSTTCVVNDDQYQEEFIQVNAEKTKLLRNIIANFNKTNKKLVRIDAKKTKLLRNIITSFNEKKPSLEDYESEYRIRSLRNREYLLKDMDENAKAFDGYLSEMHNDREKWFSEQYIYDELGM